MTYIDAYFTLPEKDDITIEKIQDIINKTVEVDYIRELGKYNGEQGALVRTIKIRLYIHHMIDLKEIMEQGIGAKFILSD